MYCSCYSSGPVSNRQLMFAILLGVLVGVGIIFLIKNMAKDYMKEDTGQQTKTEIVQ